MNDDTENLAAAFGRSMETLPQALDKFLAAAQPGAVFGAPVQSGAYTVITASEVTAGGGFGSAVGSSMAGSETASPAAGRPGQAPPGAGGGGGGGGGSGGRPVAVITIGPDGVTVKPIIDVTKLGLAGVTAWGAMMVSLLNMSRLRRR